MFRSYTSILHILKPRVQILSTKIRKSRRRFISPREDRNRYQIRCFTTQTSDFNRLKEMDNARLSFRKFVNENPFFSEDQTIAARCFTTQTSDFNRLKEMSSRRSRSIPVRCFTTQTSDFNRLKEMDNARERVVSMLSFALNDIENERPSSAKSTPSSSAASSSLPEDIQISTPFVRSRIRFLHHHRFDFQHRISRI